MAASYSTPVPSNNLMVSPGFKRNTFLMCLASDPLIDMTGLLTEAGSMKKRRMTAFLVHCVRLIFEWVRIKRFGL
jgi:hypothetical protein